MPRKPDPQLAQQWSSRLRRFRQSDQTVIAFCQREGVSTAAFYQWRRKLDVRSRNDHREATTPFVPIQLVEDDGGDHNVVQIHMPGGAVVRLPATLETQKLCQLVRHIAGGAAKEKPSQEGPSC